MGHDENKNDFGGNPAEVNSVPTPNVEQSATPSQATGSFSTPQNTAPATPSAAPTSTNAALEELRRISADSNPNAAPAPVSFTDSATSGDIVLNVPKTNNNRGKALIIGAVIAFVVVVVIALVILLTKKAFFSVQSTDSLDLKIGRINPDIIFDKSAYIPFNEDDKIGYMDPENGNVVIPAKYTKGTRFYGNYAAVTYLRNDKFENAIIDKNGNVIIVDETGLMEGWYDEENSVWYANNNVYDSDLVKLNKDNTRGVHIGNIYIENISNGAAYITNMNGDTIYSCNSVCYAEVDFYGEYLLVKENNSENEIIRIVDKKSVYKAPNETSVEFYDRGIVKNSNGYFDLNNNTAISIDDSKESISDDHEYTYEQCGNEKYKIVNKKNEVIFDCNIEEVVSLPQDVYFRFKKENRDAVIILKDGKYILYNLVKREDITEIGEGLHINVYPGSPFIVLQETNARSAVINIFETDNVLKMYSEEIVEAKNNYFITSKDFSYKRINSNMKEI